MKAINSFKDAVKYKKRILASPNDPQLGNLYQYLAIMYLNAKKYERALEYTRQEMAILT